MQLTVLHAIQTLLLVAVKLETLLICKCQLDSCTRLQAQCYFSSTQQLQQCIETMFLVLCDVTDIENAWT